MKSLYIYLIMFALLISVCALIFHHASGHNKETVQQAVPVVLCQAVRQAVSVPIHSSGRLVTKNQIKLSFKTGGIVQTIAVDEGETVHKGQLLARLDPAEIKAMAAQARSAWEKATRDLKRVTGLYADSVATLEQLQNATTAVEVSKAQLDIATFNLQHSAITAPSDGTILKRLVEPGEIIGPGMPVFIFGSRDRDWLVRVGVTDRDILRLQPHDSAHVHIAALPESTFLGYISEIAEAADPGSGTFEVEVTVPDASLQFKTGFVASVDIYPSSTQLAWLVPIEAIVEGRQNHGYVFTVKDQIAHKIPVKILSISGNQLAIEADFRKSSLLVTDGAAYLRENTPVVPASTN